MAGSEKVPKGATGFAFESDRSDPTHQTDQTDQTQKPIFEASLNPLAATGV